MCRAGDEAFKRRLVHGVGLIIMAQNNFVPTFITNMLKCKARLKKNFKCVCVTLCSLVITFLSRDYIETEID